MINILLADDHPVVRAGLKAVLETEPDLRVVAQAATADEAVRAAVDLASTEPSGLDVVLMDLQFGSPSAELAGVGATARIAALPRAPRVLILTTYDTDADILAAVEAGASGYLLKDAPPAELLAAVRAAAAGQSALAPAVALRLMDRIRTPDRSLSRRETEVLTLVAAGHSNQQIARQLFISEATVKSHLVHVFTKLGVDSRTAATAAARSLGLIRR